MCVREIVKEGGKEGGREGGREGHFAFWLLCLASNYTITQVKGQS